jgi:glycosyltransferase involved in cell wall biosynthesis
MTVYRVGIPFVGDSVGGAQISTIVMAKGLISIGHEPVFIVHEEGPLTKYLADQGLHWDSFALPTYVGKKGNLFSYLMAFGRTTPGIIKWLKQNRIDLVHAQDSRMNLTWSLPAYLAGVPFVWHQRSRFSNSRLMAQVIRLASQIVCISQFTLKTLPTNPGRRARVIYNPFDTEPSKIDRNQARHSLRKELQLPQDAVIIGTVGNLTPQKRPDIFIKAASNLASRSSRKICFLVIGSDRKSMKAALERMVSESAPVPDVRFTGSRYPIEPVLSALDVLAAPAVDEAFGRTLVEAMLLSVPVVASASAGHNEIVQADLTGLLFKSDDPQSLADKLSTLLKSLETRENLTGAARPDIVSRFSSNVHVSSILKVYADAMSGR